MLLALMTTIAFAEKVKGNEPAIGSAQAAVEVDWSRSKEITSFINPTTVYDDLQLANDELGEQDSEVRLIAIDRSDPDPYDNKLTWEFLNGLGHSETENVWDAYNGNGNGDKKYYDGVIQGGMPAGTTDEFGNDMYNNTSLTDLYTTVPAATWMHAISRGAEGFGVPSVHRFQGTFDITDAIPSGQELSNIYIGVDQSDPNGDLMMNDGMFVFVYPKNSDLSDDPNDAFYYGNFLAYWATTPINNAQTFLGTPILGVATDYYPASGI
ncbi:MAG: hypothetical protein LBB49_06790, partial [Gracilibacteraceae bacterium]|nr:hypothetical protein [Gracilibacteraceae bacterium]